MALSEVWSCSMPTVTGDPVLVRARVEPGTDMFELEGLAWTPASDLKERVRAALSATPGLRWPQGRITVTLSGLAETPAVLGLPVAAAILSASGQLPGIDLARVGLVGELDPTGRLRPTGAGLVAADAAARSRLDALVVPAPDAASAARILGIRVLGLEELSDLTRLGTVTPTKSQPFDVDGSPARRSNLRDVDGRENARIALEVAAAGGFHVMLTGPLSAALTQLAEAMTSLLPKVPLEVAREAASVRALTLGVPDGDVPLSCDAPYVAGHHSVSDSMMWAASRRPGLTAQAHGGILHLPAAGHFSRRHLDSLPLIMDSRVVRLAGGGHGRTWPAAWQLVLTDGLCPCGSFTEPNPRWSCSCPAGERRRHRGRVPGQLLDRIAVQVRVEPVSGTDRQGHREDSETVAARVLEVRARVRKRFGDWTTMQAVPDHVLRQGWMPDEAALRDADDLHHAGLLTDRGLVNVVRLAWTLADLGGRERPGRDEVHQALDMNRPAPVVEE